MLNCDLILTNGSIWTENPKQPEAESVAIYADRIVAVGSSVEVQAFAGSETRRIDLAGRQVLPGFNDAHVHLYIGGSSLTSVNLRDASGPAEFRDRIASFAQTLPRGEWILNGSWDCERWTPAELPHHRLISDVTPDHPVFVNRLDGHTVLVNELAMRLAGVDANTANLHGGEIGRDADGNLTGIFKDAAKGLIERVIPAPSRGKIHHAILAAQDYAAENGVTSVQDMGVLGTDAGQRMIEIIRVYQQMIAEGELRLRISAHIPLPEWRRAADAGIMAGLGNHFLRLGGVKSFSDGSLGSTTAWFWEPYTDAPHTSGIPSEELTDLEDWYSNLVGADSAGLQLAIHAIGDRANSVVLDSIESLIAENSQWDRRPRIEHTQHLRTEDISRFGKLGVIASVQPYHCIDDGCWAGRRIGVQRSQNTYAFRALMDAGATVAFGSDWWVAPISPLLGIHAAVTRQTLDGANPGGWMPQQKITVKEAVHAYTFAGAYASGEEAIKGSIEPGKLADLVVLSDNIFDMSPADIDKAKVDMTLLGGKIIFERS